MCPKWNRCRWPSVNSRRDQGWLNTGDTGRVDDDGWLYLRGRAKDVIIRGGHNIDPQVIEDALLSHPAVVDAAAIGRPDRRAGEVPIAFVTRNSCGHLPQGRRSEARKAGGRGHGTESRRCPEPLRFRVAVRLSQSTAEGASGGGVTGRMAT
jgi:acyl-CoA synthetase (AMP-forming)/AMP-acid ligase II